MDELVAKIVEEASNITRTVVDELYRDPFWQARYGNRGRNYSEEDGAHHLGYLVEAMKAQEPAILASYAQWLRSVLVTRGMCSLHLIENFRLIEREIARFKGGDAAARYIAAAVRSLEYKEWNARELLRVAPSVASRACAEVHHACGSQLGGESRTRCIRDALHHLSYVADALAWRRADLYMSHCVWLSNAQGALSLPHRYVDAMIAALRQAIADTNALDPGARSAADAVIAVANAAITVRPSVATP